MFRWLFRKRLFRLRMRGVNRLEYSENGKLLFLNGERVCQEDGSSLWYTFRPNHKWAQPAGELIELHDKVRIKGVIEKDFKEHRTEVGIEVMPSNPAKPEPKK